MADFVVSLLKRPMFYIATVLVMFGMVGMVEEFARPGYTFRAGPVRGVHSDWGVYAVCIVLVLVGVVLLYRLTRKIEYEKE
jgi:hypothetical protein